MKTTLLALATLLLLHVGVFADTSVPNQLSLAPIPMAANAVPPLSLRPLPDPDPLVSNNAAGSSSFAQFQTQFKPLPISGSMVFALVALFIVGMRLMGLRQAHSMAEDERHSHHGKAQMFRSLHEERSARH